VLAPKGDLSKKSKRRPICSSRYSSMPYSRAVAVVSPGMPRYLSAYSGGAGRAKRSEASVGDRPLKEAKQIKHVQEVWQLPNNCWVKTTKHTMVMLVDEAKSCRERMGHILANELPACRVRSKFNSTPCGFLATDLVWL
jgi:hypothetical protein